MKEQFTSFESFKEIKKEDVEKLAEIQRIKGQLLDSEDLPEDAKDILEQLNVEDKSKEAFEVLETREKQRETISVNEKSREVQFGRETAPIFEGAKEKLSWSLEGEQFREQGQTIVETYFKRNDGVEIRPGGAVAGEKTRFDDRDRFLPLSEYKLLKKEHPKHKEAIKNLSSDNTEEKEKAKKYLSEFKGKHPDSEWAIRALRHLNGLAIQETIEVLERDPYFVETPHVVETMEKFTKLTNRQREREQGVVIIEGEAGTGKNKLVDHYAHLTQRPLFRFTCSAGKDEQDLKYLLEYDSKRGTYRIKSTVVEALETPGAILEFDEINTLKPEVAKILNSLFDHDRALFLGEDRKSVKAATEVILVGLQNPQHYMGVKPLAETIKSRARIMEVSYPPFEKENTSPNEPIQYRADEALIIRQYVPELKDLNQQEFQILWDAEINEKVDPQAADLINSSRRERLKEVKEIVELANKIRQAYKAYHEGKSDEPIKFVFSLRESVECGYELEDAEVTSEEKRKGITKAKKAVKEVILPKIPLGEERTYLETLIAEL
ncbi:MAG: AAA family ATPase [Patescibacteria group bacterium]